MDRQSLFCREDLLYLPPLLSSVRSLPTMPIRGAVLSSRPLNVIDFENLFKFRGESACGLPPFMTPSVIAEYSPGIVPVRTKTGFVILSSMYSRFSRAIWLSKYTRRDGQHFTSTAKLSHASNFKATGMREPQPNSGRTNMAFQLIGRLSTSVAMRSTTLSTDGAARSESRSCQTRLSDSCPLTGWCQRFVKIRSQSLMWRSCLCYHSPGVPMKHMSAVVQQLRRERQHVQKQLQRIDQALAALGSSNGASRTMSAAGRRRISLAQKARWAKTRTAKPKRTMSVAARKR